MCGFNVKTKKSVFARNLSKLFGIHERLSLKVLRKSVSFSV